MFVRKADNLPTGKNQGKLAVAVERYENQKGLYGNLQVGKGA
jgi:hypothetical protein